MLWEVGAWARRGLSALSKVGISKRLRRRLAVAVIALVGVGGLLLAGVLAAHAAGRRAALERTSRGVWDPYRPGSQELLIVFAIDAGGNVQANYRGFGANPGKSAAWEDLPSPLAALSIDIEIGNPKVCWKTTSGDKECVVY